MCHEFLARASFWLFLLAVDKDLAEKIREGGCPFCGGKLHRACYLRKPRGAPEGLSIEFRSCFSFCCNREGCRKRATPPSVRFLGRHVYLGVFVVLVTAMRQGPTPRGARELKRLFGADRTTIARWQTFWEEIFPRTSFWKAARGRFASPPCELPLGLLEAFLAQGSSAEESVPELLMFLSPIAASKHVQRQLL